MENRLAKGRFVGLGLSLGSIECPVYLPAGEEDDITTRKQVFAVENFGGTSKKKLLLGPHRPVHGRSDAGGDVAFGCEVVDGCSHRPIATLCSALGAARPANPCARRIQVRRCENAQGATEERREKTGRCTDPLDVRHQSDATKLGPVRETQ